LRPSDSEGGRDAKPSFFARRFAEPTTERMRRACHLEFSIVRVGGAEPDKATAIEVQTCERTRVGRGCRGERYQQAGQCQIFGNVALWGL